MRNRVISFSSALTITILCSTSHLTLAAESNVDYSLWEKFLKYDLCITDYDSLTEEEQELCKFIFETERASHKENKYDQSGYDIVVCERARRILAGDDVGERITLEQLENVYGIWDNYSDDKYGWQSYIHCVPDIKHLDQYRGYNEYWTDDNGSVKVFFTGEDPWEEYEKFQVHDGNTLYEVNKLDVPYGDVITRYGQNPYSKIDLSDAIEINGDYYYITQENTAVFLKCGHCSDKFDSNQQAVTEPHIIENEVNGCPVTAIESCAFQYSPFTEIVLPETIEFIDTRAFGGGSYLEKINFPKGLKYIGTNAIPLMCSKLEIDCPDLILGDEAISGTAEEAYINVKSVGENAFAGLYNLKKVTFGEDVEKIEASTFNYPGSLEIVELSSSIKSIGQGVFNYKELKSITIPETVEIIGALPKAKGSPFTSGIYYPPTDPLTDEPLCAFSPDCTINSWYGTEAHLYAVSNNLNFNPMDDLLFGDANNDGNIGIADAVFLQNSLLKSSEICYEADVNKDGRIDSFDMIAMKKMLVEN